MDQMKALMAANPMPEKLKQCDDLLAALKDLHSSAPGWQGFCWGAQPITLVAGARHELCLQCAQFCGLAKYAICGACALPAEQQCCKEQPEIEQSIIQ